MFSLCCQITITRLNEKKVYTLDFAQSIEVSSSWQTLSDRATITLPKNIYIKENNSIISWAKRNIAAKDLWGITDNPDTALFTRGDIVKIEMGYDNSYDTVFIGFLDSVSTDIPITLKCIDFSYFFDRVTLNKVFPIDPSLGDVIEVIKDGIDSDADFATAKKRLAFGNVTFMQNILPGLTLKDFTIVNKNVFQVIEMLKKYEIETYSVIDDLGNIKVVFGNAYDPLENNINPWVFDFQRNVISSNLIDRKKVDVKEQVIAVSIPTEGTKVFKKQDGAASGTKTVLNFFDVTELHLNAIVKRRLDKTHYDGYEGSFQTFGQPLVRHGNKVKLVDTLHPEHNGTYRVKAVDYSFGQGGYRQNIHLHMKLS